jgi:hypothetical protein
VLGPPQVQKNLRQLKGDCERILARCDAVVVEDKARRAANVQRTMQVTPRSAFTCLAPMVSYFFGRAGKLASRGSSRAGHAARGMERWLHGSRTTANGQPPPRPQGALLSLLAVVAALGLAALVAVRGGRAGACVLTKLAFFTPSTTCAVSTTSRAVRRAGWAVPW